MATHLSLEMPCLQMSLLSGSETELCSQWDPTAGWGSAAHGQGD